MEVRLNESWNNILSTEFEKPYFQSLIDFVQQEYQTATIYPPEKLIFNAMNHCTLEEVKVVIIGQDPYHGPEQANGLSFSVADEVRHPPSLKNIFKELLSDVKKPIPTSGNLEYLANQGVLLLNATLTVKAKTPGSHQNKGWEEFTDAIIRSVSEKKEHVVFLLWGAYAQRKGEIIDRSKHHVLESPHPSPFSAHRGFFGNQHFSKANAYLQSKEIQTINW